MESNSKVVIASALMFFSSVTAAAQKISIAVFEPHESFVKASTAYGLSWDILQLAAQEEQIQLIPQQSSWDGAISRLKNNKVELIFGVLKTPERQGWLTFSYPLVPEGSMLYTLPSNPVNALSQINIGQVKVGAVDKSLHQKEAIRMGFEHIYPVNDRANLYEMLQGGRLDYVVLGITLARFYCQNESRDYGVNCLKPVGEVLMYSNVHVASLQNNKQATRVLRRLNNGIKTVYRLPGVATLFDQHGFSTSDYRQWQQQMNAFFSAQ
ncbi:substrate-binding periplasmic protein [Lacimicrobium alkaliphilum]|uniref:Solute-binding protein family 3/N-terminal domain-containing protein n=1 Tax=Lacimicrobium alkaliphilum TaxID=1526571 RepID=A0A0U2Z830_9ALTE|nr:transporter substrate-binding domain-containing protein [Lacimicrobium alkaliphilum]ALS98596.1 hypothetical protein AT746_10175 [Lacimicrobium alkaliphilum]